MDLKKFKNADSEYAQVPFWSWNDKLDKDELKRQIKEMADKGWGGYFIHSRVGLVTGYLSDEWMDCIEECVKEAEKTGTKAWLYDEDKWPSGFAGGAIPRISEEYRDRALELRKKGNVGDSDKVMVEFNYNDQDYAIVEHVSTLTNEWFNGTCYVDLMNGDVMDAYLESTHEKYKERFGQHFGKEIPGIFTDEPCYFMNNDFNEGIPWSTKLPDFFMETKGYDILDHLPSLFFKKGDYIRIRYDFYEVATKLFLESFTKKYANWCEENNMLMTGHFMSEDTFLGQTMWIGSAMPHYEYMHQPGIDKLGRHLNQVVTVKQLTSVTEQLEKDRAFCEAFGTIGQQASFFHRKWIGEWMGLLGINFINSHLSLYSMRGERKRDFPANLFLQQPWWEDEKKFSDYLTRMCYATNQGKRDVDILILHTIGSAWAEYSPVYEDGNNPWQRSVYDTEFENFSNYMLEYHLDFHYGDELIMENNAKVENGKLVVGAYSYSTVVIPTSITIKGSTYALLKQFMDEGGRVIMFGNIPTRSDGIEAWLEYEGENVYKEEGLIAALDRLDAIYSDRLSVRDATFGVNASYVISERRIDGDNEYIYLFNTKENKEANIEVKFPSDKTPYLLDFMDGEIYTIPYKREGGNIIINAKLYQSGSMFIILSNDKLSDKDVGIFSDMGIEFNGGENTKKYIKANKIYTDQPNVLPLTNVTLKVNGKVKYDRHPIMDVWHNCFYKLDEGTPFEASYTFNVADIPEGNVDAVIEVAENLDSIYINGKPVKAKKERGELGAFDDNKSWRDVNFTRVDITGLVVEGENVITIAGKKSNNITDANCHIAVDDFKNHKATEVETIYILGDFNVDLIDNKDPLIVKKDSPSENLTDSGYPFYVGDAYFEFDVQKDAGKYIRVDEVEAASVTLYINDKKVDTKYWKPYIYDVSDYLTEDINKVKVVTNNTLFNLMGPNQIDGIEEMQFVSPNTFIDTSKFTEQYQLKKYGIKSISICE